MSEKKQEKKTRVQCHEGRVHSNSIRLNVRVCSNVGVSLLKITRENTRGAFLFVDKVHSNINEPFGL